MSVASALDATAMGITLSDQLDSYGGQLHWARWQYVLEAAVAELERVSRGKEFHIWNDIVWLLLRDTLDMLVIHVASWAKSVYELGGLIGQIQANHANELRRSLTHGDRDNRDASYRRFQDEFHGAAYARLFLCTRDLCPSPQAFTGLCDRFADRMGRCAKIALTTACIRTNRAPKEETRRCSKFPSFTLR